MIVDLAVQNAQMLLVLALAPLLTGFVRKVKARLLRRRGPALLQPYRDLCGFRARRQSRRKRLVAVPHHPLSDLRDHLGRGLARPDFRRGPHVQLVRRPHRVTALLGSARFFLALAGMDAGTSFGGIGSSREMMIATLAEPATIMIVFTLALLAGSTQLSVVAGFMLSPAVGLRVSLASRSSRW